MQWGFLGVFFFFFVFVFQEKCKVVVKAYQENEYYVKDLNFLERPDIRIKCTH